MIDHVTIGVADAEAARFYERVFALLGLEGHGDLEERFREWGDFSIAPTGDGRAVTTGLHVGFAARSREHVDEWWEELRGAGYASAGEPGPRPVYTPAYYGAFVLDPAGNSIEAVHDPPYRPAGAIDHVWVRVRSLERSAAFYEAVAPVVGLEVRRPEGRIDVRGEGGSLSLLEGEPTCAMHLAFGVPDSATVEAFHRAGVDAGYRSLGEPGERPHYHPGYIGAFLADPDGHNIEAVFHGRPG